MIYWISIEDCKLNYDNVFSEKTHFFAYWKTFTFLTSIFYLFVCLFLLQWSIWHSHCTLQRIYSNVFGPSGSPESIGTDDCFSMSTGPKPQEWKREGRCLRSIQLHYRKVFRLFLWFNSIQPDAICFLTVWSSDILRACLF